MSRESFEAALARAKRRKQPVIALRPDRQFPEELDDVVVENVKLFRAEAMSNNMWWMCCYFDNGERLTFHVTRDKKPSRVVVTACEVPSDYPRLGRPVPRAPRRPLPASLYLNVPLRV